MTDEILRSQAIFQRVSKNIETVMSGQSKTIRWLLAAFASGGHILLEDYPGTGKTTLAKALAYSFAVGFKRVQFTPDLLPSDILGVSIYDQHQQTFRFKEGPLFTNILLADEINRASPRTQSALLEAMAEGQVSVEGDRHKLEAPFSVIATQNPVEFHGTYPLPEAQMDRFAMRFCLGYISAEEEKNILTTHAKRHPLDDIKAVATKEDALLLHHTVSEIRVNESLKSYVVDLVRATRTAPGVKLGASPRASLTLIKTAQALALFDGMAFLTPEPIQELAVAVIAHRLVLDPQLRFSGGSSEGIVREILDKIPVPT